MTFAPTLTQRVKFSGPVFLFIVLLPGSTLSSKAPGQQVQAGIYLTATDYRLGKAVCQPVKGKRFRISPLHATGKDTVEVSTGDSVFKIKKAALFAYCLDGKTAHRLYNNKSYSILQPHGRLILYQQTVLGGHKNKEQIRAWFFSALPDLDVKPLTIRNLKCAFAQHTAFHLLLDLQFCSDAELMACDPDSQPFRVNRMLEIADKLAPLFNEYEKP